MSGVGFAGAGLIPLSQIGSVARPYLYNFNLDDATFTAAMAVRAGAKAFDAAPIFQGKWDGTGTPDLVSFPRGTLLGNQTQYFYSNFDPHQGTISFWINPEWAGDDGIEHNIAYASSDYRVYKSTGNALVLVAGGQTYTGPSTAAWTAGTAYYITVSWDTKNTIDGTNYARWSVNDAHTYSMTTQPTASAPDAAVYVGSTSTPTLSADAGIEGFVCSRIVWYDGTYGVPAWFDETGPVDVINAVYAAGAGADPATLFGSWDVTAFVPTDQTQGELATAGQAHSHPHGSQLIDVPFVDDGGLPGTDQSVVFDATSTVITVTDNATIQDLHDAQFTMDAWVLANSLGESNAGRVIIKGVNGVNGWQVFISAGGIISFVIYCATTNATAFGTLPLDGKWHLITCHWNDGGARRSRVAVDGVWGGLSVVAAGAVVTDVGDDLYIGNADAAASRTWDGSIAWVEISDNDRHSAGTDFIPPRVPYSDGNTVEYWAMDEGTGATVAASVTTPANDGTITSGTWAAIWDVVGTPEIPQSLQFYQENDGIDFGSGANIDDLPTGDCTIEAWALVPIATLGTAVYIITKRPVGAFGTGWDLIVQAGGGILARIGFAAGDVLLSVAGNFADGHWHHYAIDFDIGTVTGRLFIDGALLDTDAGAGAYQSAAANDCVVNAFTVIGTSDASFSIGWIRLSDNRRYTGSSFIPASRNNPPANDANAQLLVNMDDGAGTTATDTSGNGYNGTITFGATTRWNNTPDLSIDEPGRMIYQQGYNVGSDGANDGIYIPHTLTAATDYVIRVPLQYSPQAWPRITLYDVVAAGAIVDFDAPPLSAVHDGGAGAAAFTSTGEVYPASLIGGTIYNVTDGSSGTITAVGGTNQDTITAALAGGGSNDWQVGEQAYIVPVDGWLFNEPIVVRTSANTDYELRITNRNSDGIITIHQAEHLLSLLDNGDHESLNGGFPGAAELMTGWTNQLLDAGDTEPEAVVVHSGAQSLEWNISAVAGEMQYFNDAVFADGTYYTLGVWTVGDSGQGLALGTNNSVYGVLHTSTTLFWLDPFTPSVWGHRLGVYRGGNVRLRPSISGVTGATGDRWTDDVYAIELDPITLTVTPAGDANSQEQGGIRVDGRDSLTVPATVHKMLANIGGLRWRVTPRHDLALAQGFGQASEYLLDLTEDANNYLRLYRTTNLLTLAVNQNGTGEVTDTDATAWAVDAEVLLEVVNLGGRIIVRRDGVQVLELAGLAGFAADFTAVAYFTSEDTPSLEFDGVISPP